MTADQATFDVVVVGSGAAGMTAALTAAHHGASVVVIEKTGRFGGSTARSGGGVWVPGNEVLRRAGVADTPEQARAYLAHIVDGCVPAARQQALLEHGPAMLGFVRAHTPVDFAWVPNYADYYPEAPGGLAKGRSIEPVPLNGGVLGGERGGHPGGATAHHDDVELGWVRCHGTSRALILEHVTVTAEEAAACSWPGQPIR